MHFGLFNLMTQRDRGAEPRRIFAEMVEQVRLADYPWGMGVQYHPERDAIYTPLFEAFFAQLRT